MTVPSWAATRRAIAADKAQLLNYFGEREPLYLHAGFAAAILHRLAHYLHAQRWPRMARLLRLVGVVTTGADIDPAAVIGPGLTIPNPQAITLRGVIGRNLLVLPVASVGSPYRNGVCGTPVLGDDVVLETGALVMGAIRVGHRARVGARCLVTEDLPDDAEVLPLGWRRVRM